MFAVQGTDVDEQLAFAAQVCQPWRAQVQEGVWARACEEAAEVGFGPIEADFLYCFIRSKLPGRIVQIGCGASTAIMLRAYDESAAQANITCIEPYPSDYLRNMDKSGKLRLVCKKAQEVDRDVLLELGDGDLFFVDSTHTVKAGSEVNRIILDLLPRLKSGTYVHFHDINFPYDYQRGLLSGDLFHWSEGSLLQAFLADNPRYTIRASMSMLHYARADQLRKLLPRYRPASNWYGLTPGMMDDGDSPASIYLQVVR